MSKKKTNRKTFYCLKCGCKTSLNTDEEVINCPMGPCGAKIKLGIESLEVNRGTLNDWSKGGGLRLTI